MWFTEERTDRIGRTEYPGVSPGSDPTCIVRGPDGDLWFTERDVNHLGRDNLH
jgi:virginiamycin B lyase